MIYEILLGRIVKIEKTVLFKVFFEDIEKNSRTLLMKNIRQYPSIQKNNKLDRCFRVIVDSGFS